MVRTKVFVGNLSFTTKENELAKEFELAGKVISANIITRGPRSLGYGFVEMDNETDAENAVKLLDKKEIDGRPINVEVAKPREEGASDIKDANAQRGSRPRRGRGGKINSTRPQGQQQTQGQRQPGQADTQEGQTQGRRQPRRRVADEGEDASKGPRKRVPKPRSARPEGEADTRTPSTTTLFVANLPFAVDDDAFSKLLKDGSLAFKTAHVVKKRTGRSKGFGFIEFENEADQQKALAALNDKPVEGRQLAVKVALTELRSTEDQTAKSTSSPAPTKSTTNAPAKTTTTSTSSPAPAKSTSSPAPSKNTTSSPVKTSSPAPVKSTDKKDEKPTTPKQDKK